MTKIHPLAQELNQTIHDQAPAVFSALSDFGKRLYFPKGIVSQSNEAKDKAHRYNATIGIATSKKEPISLPCVRKYISSDISDQEIFPYAPTAGIKELRSTWLSRIKKLNPDLALAPTSLPVVTNALTQGLSVIAEMFVNPGDPVLISDKNWGNYRFILENKFQAQITYFPSFNETLTGLDIGGLDLAITKVVAEQKTKGQPAKVSILFNFPNNPTGYTQTLAESSAIPALLKKHAEKGTFIIAVCDDAYFGMVYESGISEISLFGKLINAHPNILAIKVDGATKEVFMWGFRLGFLTLGNTNLKPDGFEALEKKLAGAIRSQISNVSHPGQSILLHALKDPNFSKEQKHWVDVLKSRYRIVKEVVYKKEYRNHWDVYPFNSGYFMCIKLKHHNAEVVRVKLLDDFGIGVISLEGGDLRIAYSCLEEDEIEPLFQSIKKVLEGLA